jgi:transketolase
MSSVSVDDLCINTIRTLSMDAVQAANSGHPGTPMALAPLCYVLWTRHLRHDPEAPEWEDRDRFVLSCGHASMLLYSLLYLTGYDLPLEEIKRFRQLGSKTPGHPENWLTPGVETTTGPLGQGLSNAVGMAMAEAHLAAVFNRPGHDVVDHHTYFLASDGDLMEGISHEAASLAGHHRLGKLIGFYDDNHITIDGETSLAFSDDTQKRFEAYHWHVIRVEDGNDLDALDGAITAAKAETARPSLVIVRTHIAFGSPHKQDTAEAHGAPLGKDEVAATKRNLHWPSEEPFYVPPAALERWRECVPRGAGLRAAWEERFEAFRLAHESAALDLERRWLGELPEGWDADLPTFSAGEAVATRGASGKTLNALAKRVPELLGGAADLSGSVKSLMADSGTFSAADRAGRNLHFGVREHAMGGILNGLALHGGVRPYGGTFLIFSDYMRPSLRLAAMMRLPTVYLFSHDSIGLGEDGPTHQPTETLAALRAIPGLTVIRPADANATVEAWKVAMNHRGGPVALVLTRQNVPVQDRTALAPASGLWQGGYVLSEPQDGMPRVIVMASGSEVALALDAQESLRSEGIGVRVVDMPSMELFEQQSETYRNEVLPLGIEARVAIEAASPLSWYRWVGPGGEIIGMEGFGASGPYQDLYRAFGITSERVVEVVRRLVDRQDDSR